MIFYSAYIIIMMLQLVLGHPISSSNNQDVAITRLKPRTNCSNSPTILPVNTLLPLNIHIPNTPINYDPLQPQIVFGSPTLRQVNYRTIQADGSAIAHLHVFNVGQSLNIVDVVGVHGSMNCFYPGFIVQPAPEGVVPLPFQEYSWFIIPGYTYYLRVITVVN
jgi:hypothetical protein